MCASFEFESCRVNISGYDVSISSPEAKHVTGLSIESDMGNSNREGRRPEEHPFPN